MTLGADLKKLVLGTHRGNGSLPTLKARDAIPAARGDADYSDTNSGTSIKSLTEKEGVRQYYTDEVTWTSSDGVFVFVALPIKETVFVTQNGESIPTTYRAT